MISAGVLFLEFVVTVAGNYVTGIVIFIPIAVFVLHVRTIYADKNVLLDL